MTSLNNPFDTSDCIPDYDARVSINVVSGHNTWTAAIDCFVYVEVQTSGNGIASISNEDLVSIARQDNTNPNGKILSAGCFVNKGKVIDILIGGTLKYCYYAPLKGAI